MNYCKIGDIELRHWSFPFEQLRGKDVLPILKAGLSCFDKRKYWLSAGTLLGLERDGDFIPYDTDIDIAVLGKREVNLSNAFRPIRFVDVNGKPMQRAYLHEPSNIIFDIFHYYEKDGRIFNTQEQGSIYRDSCLVRPLSKKIYRGHEFGVPNDIDAYLTQWYGDWRTPVVGGKTEWQR